MDNAVASPLRFTPAIIAACVFTAAYMLAATIAAIATGNGEFIFYIVVMVVLIAAVSLVHLRIRLSTGVLFALSLWGALHMAGGLLPVPESWPINGDIRVLYSWWIIPAAEPGSGYLKYDQIIHAFGFGVTTWVCWQALRAAVDRRLRPTIGLMALCAAAGVGFGALNEIVEFIATMLGPTNVGGYVNTGWDLVSNTVGSVIAAMLIYITGRRAAA
jgi:hypothetical protein